MASHTERQQHVDGDGVRTIKTSGVRPGVWLLVLAVALIGVAGWVFMRSMVWQSADEELDAAPTGRDLVAAPPAAKSSTRFLHPPSAPRDEHAVTVRDGAAPGSMADAHVAGPDASADAQPSKDDPVFGDGVAHEGEGILAFPPPGTKPIKRGIVVPDDFVLPPGYVRHYQTTDNGHQLPAILMFHPDYQPTNERGEPLPLPVDRVVPPNMAPAGLAIEMLQVPDAAPPDRDAADDVGETAH